MESKSRGARELMGAAVYSVAEGKRVGEVVGLRVDRERRRVALLTVANGALSHPRYLAFSRIERVGEDAVMIPSEAALAPALSGAERQALEEHLTGRRVLSQSGEHLGSVTDYRLELTSGRIEAYRFQPEAEGLLTRLLALGRPEPFEIPDGMVITLGADALVVPDDVAAFVHSAAAEH
jgi:uncharacterized protein YrrD